MIKNDQMTPEKGMILSLKIMAAGIGVLVVSFLIYVVWEIKK